jgi:hypothetical protein
MIVPDFSNIEEVNGYILDNKLLELVSGVKANLNINLFLKEDLSINLELLELAIMLIRDKEVENIYIHIEDYCISRGIHENLEQIIIEIKAIYNIIKSMAEEIINESVKVYIVNTETHT